ncbi:glycosyltransferase family 4 protein [Fulvivirga lutea]|uniref:Glycosyltransferase family 4 protein n=1 Tax=Fulvivirga lutea TaxID=2810512 RepID=A0A974WIG7_9BACT|nr:glycosyltransferase family 4 protein [Fulvivirga lutea]QSE99164.1 glycosyltransferase family 4 protein [Fulvivirga lutea]
MKILMIGPSKSDSQNYGLGLATENIAKQLGAKADLTIVSPVHASQMAMSNESEQINVAVEETLLDAKSVDATAVQINVETILTPYFYHPTREETKTEVTDAAVEIQQALKMYSESVVEQVENLEYDVIYAHDWLSIGAALQLKAKYKKPLMLHIHALDYDRVGKKTDSWIYKLEKEGMDKADVVVAVSDYHANIMQSIYKIDKSKIKVVHLASQKVEPVNYTSPFAEDIILFAGRLSQQKGIFMFIEIAAELVNNHNDLRFVVSGNGELSQEVVSKVNEKGLAGHFNFTGLLERNALHALMRESKVLVMPSISEPFGLVAMEAAINELPIIISGNSGAKEVLKGALIPEKETVASYIKLIEKVLSGKEVITKGVAQNKEAASKRTWEMVGKEIFQILTA